MNIEIYRGTFSKFNEGVTIIVKGDGATLTEDIDKKELASTAYQLLDIAYDLLNKHREEEHEPSLAAIADAMEGLSK